MHQRVPLWITDSSMVEWNDTIKLEVSFPRWRWPQVVAEGLGAHIDDHYEGIVDPGVAVGGLELAWREGGLDAEAEWAVLFPEPLANYEHIGPETPCVLQGMVDGKWMAPLAQPGDVGWRGVTEGNNLLARGRGITTTIGAILHGDSEVAGAMVLVNFPLANGDIQMHRATGADLRLLPVMELVEAVWRWCRENPDAGGTVRGINFGANGEMSAYARDFEAHRHAIRRALLPHVFRKLMELSPKDAFDVVNEVRGEFFADLIERGQTARPNATILLTVTNGSGYLVGQGAMMLTEELEAENKETVE